MRHLDCTSVRLPAGRFVALPGFVQNPGVGSVAGHTLLTSTFVNPAFWSSILHTEGRSPEAVFYHRGNVIVVPPFQIGGPLCPWCVALRLAAASQEPAIQRHFLRGIEVYASIVEAHPVGVHSAIVQDLLASRSNLPQPELVVSSRSLSALSSPIRHHAVRPVPGPHGHHHLKDDFPHGFPKWRSLPLPATNDPINLVDELVGPIRALLRDKDDSGAVTVVADTGHLGDFVKWAPDATGSGTATSEVAASKAAIGEAVERYSGNFVPIDRLVERRESDFHGLGEHVLTPACLGSHYYAQRFPQTFRPYDPDELGYWINGTNLVDKTPVWVPAEAAILNFTRRSGRRPQFPVPLTGIAAGPTDAYAVAAALLETVERDAVMRWWFGGTPAYEISAVPDEIAHRKLALPPPVRTWWLFLESDLGIPVVAGCLYDSEHQIVTAGFAARTQLARAMEKAMFEAAQSRAMILQFLDPQSAMRLAVESGKLAWPVLPHDRKEGIGPVSGRISPIWTNYFTTCSTTSTHRLCQGPNHDLTHGAPHASTQISTANRVAGAASYRVGYPSVGLATRMRST